MPTLVRFGPFELDVTTADLHLNGGRIRLPEQQFQILEMLLRGQGNLVSREEIRRRLWPNDTIVEFDRSINAAIKKLRAALDDSADAPRFIETVARRGYRILVEVHFPEASPATDAVRKTGGGSLAGQRVSHYRVLTLLGGGGMGLVYKAEDLKLNRPVALKFLPEELGTDPITLQRFEREARTASSLNHPNICTIHGVEEHGTQPFIVMELLEGETLRELISRYAFSKNGSSYLPLQQVLEIGIQIADGLDAAHQKGIIHRDIKPANIFVTTRGQIKILDFGLAKLATTETDLPSNSPEEDQNISSRSAFRPGSSIEHSVSRTGIAMGTAGYMSPEQMRGEKLDSRTDLFSFGLIIFEMATGQRAFGGDTAAIVHDAIHHRALPPMRELNPELPVTLEEIIRKALEKNRESRYRTAADMLADLKSSLKAIQASPTASIETSATPGVRSTLGAGIFVGGALLLLGTISLLWSKYSRPFLHAEIKERQLTTNSGDNPVAAAAISGDGKYLVFEDNSGIHLRALESRETRNIPNPAQFGDTHVHWSIHWFPDSTRFFAVSHLLSTAMTPPSWEGLGRVTTWEASVMGGELHKVRDDAEAWAVSPDGFSVAETRVNKHELGSMHELWVTGIDGAHPQKLLDAGDQTNVESVQWSPDGTRLLYVKSEEDGARRSIEIRDLKSGNSHVVLSNPQLGEIYWLRDGRVLYTMTDPAANTYTCNYWVARIDKKTGAFASQPTQLTHYSGFGVEFTSATADSKKLVFEKRSPESAVYVADVEAGGTRITPPKHLGLTKGVEFPNGWTVDSNEVVFTSNRDETLGIYRQPLSGGPAQPMLIDKTGEFGFPRPSPDGHWLLIEHNSAAPHSGPDLYRVPLTGGHEELIARDVYDVPTCANPSTQLCAYAKTEKNELVFTSFDPRLKQRRELGRFKIDPYFKGIYAWALSPDATGISILEPGTGNLYLLNLTTHKLKHIIVKHWNNFVTLDWAADGKGLFMFCLQPGGVLLHVDLHGNAQVLWEPGGEHVVWALPSPDGKHVAVPLSSSNLNVWMMENF